MAVSPVTVPPLEQTSVPLICTDPAPSPAFAANVPETVSVEPVATVNAPLVPTTEFPTVSVKVALTVNPAAVVPSPITNVTGAELLELAKATVAPTILVVPL